MAATLRRRNDPRRPVPTITFQDRLTLEAGASRCAGVPGPNHEPGNSFTHLPRLQVLMLVDVIVPGWVPFTRLDPGLPAAGPPGGPTGGP